MQLITFKMDEPFLKEIDNTIAISGFNNRTEFIRSALREKLDRIHHKQYNEMKLALEQLNKPADKKKLKKQNDELKKIISERGLNTYQDELLRRTGLK